jgi:septal ring factor EnvC (AmiA/AmiB activator)
MRVVVAGLLSAALAATCMTAASTAFAQDSAPALPAPAPAAPQPASQRPSDPAPDAPSQDDASVARALREVAPYASQWDAVGRDIASLTTYTEGLASTRRQYRAWESLIAPALAEQTARAESLASRVQELAASEAATAAALEQAQLRKAAQERTVGALARLLYTQPAPELSAVEQILEGEDLRAFDRQNLVSDVLEANMAELQAVVAEVTALETQLADTRAQLQTSRDELVSAAQRRDQLADVRGVIEQSLAAIEADTGRATAEINAIRAAEEARLKAEAAAAAAAAAAAEAAAAAAAASGSVGGARPTGGGAPAQSQGGDFSGRLPAYIPFRNEFLTYGLKYRVEPGLLAAIASQESNFNPWAGCSTSGGGGKGIMQLENQPQYCGPDAVGASVERAAIMLAGYYNRSKSWTAAIFAYNNGPGLMDEWVQYGSDKATLLSVLAAYYNKQPYASPGPYQGYPSWGDWRARVAYNYAAPNPDPGFRSATQKWLIYRQG